MKKSCLSSIYQREDIVAESIYKGGKKDALEELFKKNNRTSCVKDIGHITMLYELRWYRVFETSLDRAFFY